MDITQTASTAETIASPVAGETVAMADVPDPVFASEVMGRGAAVEPTEGKVFSPVDGVVTAMADTGHAVALLSDAGCEILIHLGIDTVALGGEPFTPYAAVGDHVSKGDLLMDVDLEKVRAAGLSAVTPVIVTNTDDYEAVETHAGSVSPGDPLIEVR